jgi:hypothetical protein
MGPSRDCESGLEAVGRQQWGRKSRRERMSKKRMPAAERPQETAGRTTGTSTGGRADNWPDTGWNRPGPGGR